MTERRSGGLTEEEIEQLADKLFARMPQPSAECKLTPEQQAAVVELLTAKKKVVRWTLYLIGALVLWVVKDIYYYIIKHVTWGQP